VTTGTAAHEHSAGLEPVIRRSQQMGVLLLIAADAAFVLSLLFAYLYLRNLNTEGGWLSPGAHTLGPANGWIIAAIIVLSAAAYGRGEVRSRTRGRGELITGTSVALALLLADLAAQVWRMVTMNVSVGENSYASCLMVLSGAHVFHLLITLVLGVGIWIRARREPLAGGDGWHARMVSYWWYWVAFSAVLVALTTTFTRT
jgi:heme/copper-type cytochrome/quinol oxidase subunit 3